MSECKNILVVDDDELVRERLTSVLAKQRYNAVAVADAEAALEIAESGDFDAFFVDLQLPGIDGFELIGRLRETETTAPVVIITAHGNLTSAVTALRAGAYDFLTKPVEPATLQLCLERIFQMQAIVRENDELRRASAEPARVGQLIGSSEALKNVVSMVRRVADSSSTVLVTGESGTGKDVVARSIHDQSLRSSAPYLPINCAAIPDGLLESELFGHTKGAFSGAVADKVGIFEAAEGGTVFLDEIAEMDEGLQAKLLRFLQDREVRPVGANQGRRVDVRVVAATNRDLRREVQKGSFRQDLYFRLNVIPIAIPPLRERPDDVVPLAEFFLARHGGADRELGLSAIDALRKFGWPGNARELENVVERALALSDATVLEATDLHLDEFEDELEPDLGGEGADRLDRLVATAAEEETPLRRLEDRYIDEVLRRVDGNKNQAARILGINRATLYRRKDADG